jgi:hypothetical protein
MKFDFKDILLGILGIVVVLLLIPRVSFADTPAPPANCDPEPIDMNIPCKVAKPDFPKVGDFIENSTKKYCCKKSS